MAEFTLPLTAEGSVTAPTGSFTFIEPSAESETFVDSGPMNTLEIEQFGWALADGVNPLRLVTKGAVYDCGGLAPGVAATVAGTGSRATATQTFTAATNPQNGDQLELRPSNPTLVFSIQWRTALSSTFSTDETLEIKIGATLADTIARVQGALNGDVAYVEGTDYHWVSTDMTLAEAREQLRITVSATAATTITYRSTVYGVTANAWLATEIIDNGASWSVTSFSGGTAATGLTPTAGTRRIFYTWFREADGAETGRSPIASVTQDTDGAIAVSNLTASADTTFDYIRIYSTTDLGVEFFLAGAVPRATTTFTHDIDDQVLARSSLWNELLYRAYAEGRPPRGRALALWKGSIWSLGAHVAADYKTGTVSVTEGNATITFSVKGVSSLMRNRTFKVDSTSESYTILSVSETGPTAVLDRVYEGTTNATATFRIIDDYDPTALRRCVQFLYNQWPVDESPGNVDTDDPEGGTALLATKSRLFAFTKTSISALSGDGPDSWELAKIADDVGCVAPRLVVGVGGGGIFLSPDGFWAISPDETLTCISSLKAPKKSLAVGIDGTVARIAWANVDQGYSYYDRENRTVVFGVPLDDAVVPNYEIVFDLQNATWTTFKRSEWTAGANATMPDGNQFILTGDRGGNLWHEGIGESDGAYGFEAVATLTGAQTVRTLTASGASFPTTGDALKGVPVIVLYADGSTVAFAKIASNTGTVLTLAEDLATAPAASDQVVVGGIASQWKTGFTTFGEEYRIKSIKSITVRHAPSTRNEYYLAYAVNGGSLSLPPVGTGIGALTETDGKVRHFIQYPGDTHQISVRKFKPGGRAIFRGGVFELAIREQGRR